jgi:hypothetical protein
MLPPILAMASTVVPAVVVVLAKSSFVGLFVIGKATGK